MSSSDTFVDYYAMLGVDPSADADTIQEEIKKQRKTWRKRQGLADDQARRAAEEHISHLTEAEKILLNSAKRQEYDERRKQEASRARPAPSPGSESTTDWLARAEEYLEMGDPMSASYAAREATSERGDEHRAWAVRGRASMLQGDDQAAMFEFREALRLRPDEPEYHFDLGTIQEEFEDFNGALESYRKVAELAPDNLIGNIGVASVLVRIDQPKEAIEILDNVLEQDPNNEQAQFYLAIALHDRCFEIMERKRDGNFVNTSEEQARRVLQNLERAQGLKVDDPEIRDEIRSKVATVRDDFEVRVDRSWWRRARADPWSPAGFTRMLVLVSGLIVAVFVGSALGAAGSGLLKLILSVVFFAGWVWFFFVWMQRRPQYEINRRVLERERKGKI
jgi:predicted Zn-dependent protease